MSPVRMMILAALLGACSSDSLEGDTATDTGADPDTTDDAQPDRATDRDTSELPAGFERRLLAVASDGASGPPPGQFVEEYDEAVCAAISCDEVTAPVLDEPLLEVNGQIVAPDTVVHEGDEVRVLVGYSDEGCDVRCGTIGYSYESPLNSGGSIRSLGSNLPCSSAEGSVYLGFYFTVQPGTYSYSGSVGDACGNASNRVEGAFVVE